MNKRISGVYGIQCRKTGKWYVGAGVDITRRIKSCFYDLRNGWRREMGEDYQKHGPLAFKAVILEEADKDDLAEREAYWVDNLQSLEHGYNQQAAGSNRHWSDNNER
jgi:group I intron endonuclease